MHDTAAPAWLPAGAAAAKPGRRHSPLLAALGLSVSLHLMLLAGIQYRLPMPKGGRPAPLTAYLVPRPAKPRPSVAPSLTRPVPKKMPDKAPAKRRMRHALKARSPVRPHRAPKRAPMPMEARRHPVPHEHLAHNESPVLHERLAHHQSPVPHERPAPQHPVRLPPRNVRLHRHLLTRQRPAAPVPAPSGSMANEANAPRPVSGLPHRGRRQPAASGQAPAGQAAPEARMPDEALAAAPGSDIVVTGRGASVHPAPERADPAAKAAVPDRPPVPIDPVHPAYPLAARRDNVEGVAVVRIWVDSTGGVTRVQLLRASPPGYFEAAAIDAVRQWHFAPAIRNGRPVDAEVSSYTLRFGLLDADD